MSGQEEFDRRFATMDELDEMLGIDMTDPREQLARDLVLLREAREREVEITASWFEPRKPKGVDQ